MTVSASRPVPQPGILDIGLYVAGASRLGSAQPVLKLSANENPHGAPPGVAAAVQAALGQINRYPGTDHADLRAAIGAVHGLDPDRIICGVGSDEVLQFIAQAYAGPGDEVITTEHGFLMYPILARAAGAAPIIVPENRRVIDADAILAAVTPRTRIVFVANPANPTGTMVSEADLYRLADSLPGNCLLVIDGAYAEFSDGFDGGISLVGTFAHVVMTRTFSKIYGLGGLRIGWGYAQREVIDVLNRLRQPFNLSELQLAAATAAVNDRTWVARCREENRRWRSWMQDALRQMGIACDDSSANFVLARFADAAEAAACDQALRAEGIIVRGVAAYGLPEALRITVGDEEGCRRVIGAIARFKGVR
jgi:histidinol-phosphate aminotransferase